MIHEVKLSDKNRRYLSQIVRLQVDLLWAAVELAQQDEPFSRERVRVFLSRKSTGGPRAERIVNWLFDGRITKPTNLLQEFIDNQEGDTFLADGQSLLDEKLELVRMIRRDIACLYPPHNRCGAFEFYLVKIGRYRNRDILVPPATLHAAHAFANYNRQGVPQWLKAVKKFFIYFYDKLDFPKIIFPTEESFGRGEFFTAYEQANQHQYVCAICDEHRPITILRGTHFSEIEHYFPKNLYPHLACHPYNLIPICGACNTAHSDRDPLQPKDKHKPRRTLGQVFLPYRNESVRQQGVVKIDWRPPTLSIRERQADPNNTFSTKLEAFSEIYDIPRRWQGRINQIGEQLWRRISTYMKLHSNILPNSQTLKTELEGLLGYLLEDLGKEPYDYVLIWYLAFIIVEELEKEMDTGSGIPVLDTIRDILEPSSHGQNPDEVLEIARALYP
jgi:hypothetical protein